jgi:magnesium chelatase subunit I
VPRILDIYAALPSMTGKIELEYEGELKGGDFVARELIRTAVGKIYDAYFDGVNVSQITRWFEMGGAIRLDESQDSATMVKELGSIQGLFERTDKLGLGENEQDPVRASAGEFVLEGLYAHRRISRSEELGFTAGERERKPARERETPDPDDYRRPSSRKQFN